MTIVEDVSITVSASLAQGLIERAGIEAGDGGWALPDGSRTRDPSAALGEALVMIGEEPPTLTVVSRRARRLA